MAAYVLKHCYILLVMKMKIMPTLLCWRVIVLQEVDTLHKWPCPPSLPDVGQFNQIKLPVIPFQIQINNFGSPLAYQNLDALARPWRILPTYFCVTQSQSHALKMRTQMCSFSVTFLLQKITIFNSIKAGWKCNFWTALRTRVLFKLLVWCCTNQSHLHRIWHESNYLRYYCKII